MPSAAATGVRPAAAASAAIFAATIAESSGALPSGPNTAGKCAGCSRPRKTCASVTVSGPPPRYAAGPGTAPAEAGPTRSRVPSHRAIDPPPAATVSIANIGVRMRTPATTVSLARSKLPAQCETSVEVPPMSKPISCL